LETKDIKNLMELFAKLPLKEMKINNGETTLFLAKHAPVVQQQSMVSALQPVVDVEVQPQILPEQNEGEDLLYVTSPIVGTFYAAANPKADPYIKEGDRVKKGQVICIVEAMKLMNEIQAEFAGEVVDILVENAQPVEYGQKLFSLKK